MNYDPMKPRYPAMSADEQRDAHGRWADGLKASVVSNPTKAELQARFDTIKAKLGKHAQGLIMRGVADKTGQEHHWANAFQMTHGDLENSLSNPDDAKRMRIFVYADGQIVGMPRKGLGGIQGNLEK